MSKPGKMSVKARAGSVWQNPNMRLILASASQVRADILKSAGLVFDICASGVDEAALKQQHMQRAQSTDADQSEQNTNLARTLALTLAIAKAQAVASQQDLRQEGLVIGADQILTCAGRFFDKPRNLAEAADNLQFLRGKTHTLTGGIVLAAFGEKYKGAEIVWRDCVSARLTMRAFSDDFLGAYLQAADKAILSSVGCYRLEAEGAHLFSHIEGDYFTILGLPLLSVLNALRNHNAVQL